MSVKEDYYEQIQKFNWYPTIIGVVCMIVLYAMKQANAKYLPKAPLPVEVGIS